jgi:hypothetical protein
VTARSVLLSAACLVLAASVLAGVWCDASAGDRAFAVLALAALAGLLVALPVYLRWRRLAERVEVLWRRHR